MGRKIALIIGNSRYDDPGLARLAAADVDVRELAGVLRTPEIGQFDEVVELPDEGLAVVRRSIARFFSQAKKDDLLVFYFSGHGIKDENGHLYLGVRDTEPHLLAGTSIEAAFITAQMDRSSSKRQVLILDCCHSGAFAHGTKAGAAQVVGTAPAFEGTGYGRVVLTATDSTQYAWQGDEIIGESDKSVFTHYLLEGLRTGEADRDGDGLITIDELYDYVYERVVSETPKQTPGKWSYKQQGDIVIARNPRPFIRAAELPLELRALLESSLSRLRAEATQELAALLQGKHRGLALAARKALEDLRADDSRRVSAAAEAVLATLFQQDEAAAAVAKEAERVRIEAEHVRSEVEQLLAEASEQLARQDLSGALAAVEAAQQLDPSSATADTLRGQIQLAIEEARKREELERQIHERRQKIVELIAMAGQAASHEAAIEVLNDALELEPGHEGASQLLEGHTAAIEQMAAERTRLEKIAAIRRQVEDLLHRDELKQAEQLLAQAEKDTGDPSAFEDARGRLRHKQHDRLAFEVVERARREFSAGSHQSAMAALERFSPPHSLVSRVLADLANDLERLRLQEGERKQAAAEQLRRQEEERKQAAAEQLRLQEEERKRAAAEQLRLQDRERRRSEAEQLARKQKAVALRDTARSHIGRQQFVEALRALSDARQLDPEATELSKLVETAEAGKAAVEEADRRRHDSESKLGNALKLFRKRDFQRALELVNEAYQLDPENSAAFGLRGDIQKAIDERAVPVDRTESAGQTQTPASRRSVLSFLRLSRPLQVGLVAVVLAVGLLLFGVPGREAPSTENSKLSPLQSAPTAPQTVEKPTQTVPAPAQDTSPAPLPASPSLQSEKRPTDVPASVPSSVPAPSRTGAQGGNVRAVVPTGTNTSRTSPGSPGVVQPSTPAAPAPSDVALRIERFLAEGDRLMEARNYDAAVSAYEEAGRLGSAAGRDRVEKVGQEKAAQVRLRLSRVERLLDTGDYEEATRVIEDALKLDPKSAEAARLRRRVLDAQSFEKTLRSGQK